MPTYRIEEESDTSAGLQLIFYVLMFTILLPVGIIYVIYKIVMYFVNHKKEKVMQEENARRQEELERKRLQADASRALMDLKTLYDRGIITNEEYQARRSREIEHL